ncbi:hypothetical protein V1227_05075 [Lentzea sp. DG1S-22]|nr:hypothetical protein [Lentzea sp. DG1S-22]WVH82130.1 hypothetical protein V1227_05075 [Lentzea sp. DG1S-22]
MAAFFHYPIAVEKSDAIGASDRPHPMRDHHDRPAGHQAVDAVVDC